MARDNRQDELFKLKKANMVAVLKLMNQKGILSHKAHFDLWRRLSKIKSLEALDEFAREVSAIYEEKKDH